MIEAYKKRDENIVEYVLYMFHTEDVIRSLNMNPKLILKELVEQDKRSTQEKAELSKWYLELIENMERENLQEYGHLPEIIETIGELSYLHKMLINVLQDREYIALWEKAYENIVDLQKKSNDSVRNPIELCFNGIYGTLMLRIQKRSINQETLDAVETFSKLLTCLSKRYNDVRSGNLRFPASMQN